jgi:hypothetical protein
MRHDRRAEVGGADEGGVAECAVRRRRARLERAEDAEPSSSYRRAACLADPRLSEGPFAYGGR